MSIDVIGAKYDSQYMDFEYLMKQDKRTLYIFNDNQIEHNSNKRGGGNAKIRIYNKFSQYVPPRSAGIPTGHFREGYKNLDECKQDIDNALAEIRYLLSTGNYDRVVYSIENYGSPILGRGIFVVDGEVKCYITKEILSLGLGSNYYFKSSARGIEGPISITSELISKL